MAPTPLPAPFFFEPSTRWAGSDGNWSTFSIGVGTPPQYFDVFPSTISSEIWVPVPQGCTWAPAWLGCGNLRGVRATSGPEKNGFESDDSKTWDSVGIYSLGAEQNLYGPSNEGWYGLDTVVLNTSDTRRVPGELVAGISTVDFWLGSFGLGDSASQFSSRPTNISSFLSSMKDKGDVPSLSYGYTAGASYKSSPASLTLGGYEQTAYEPSNINFDIPDSKYLRLPVSLKSILVVDSLKGTISAPIKSSGLKMSVDSTVSQIWLPKDACDALADALDLTFDPATELYKVDTSTHQRLLERNPQFTFQIAANSSTSDTTNIVLPYSAFDLRAYLPFYNTSTPYFPIRRAANESQYVLGRTFLQEAYITVDWERKNFTLGQVKHNRKSPHLVPIPPVEPKPASSTGLGTGAIVGIAIGGGVFVIVLGVALWLYRRRSSREKGSKLPDDKGASNGDEAPSEYLDDKKRTDPDMHELHDGDATRFELGSNALSELHGQQLQHQLMSRPIYELDGLPRPQELEALNKPPYI